ncbi:MAG: AI-2E family transporter, partial [Proteobacteria bacterium]
MNESIDPIRVASPSPSIPPETDSLSPTALAPTRMKVEIDLPMKTVFKLLAVAAMVCLLYLLAPILVTLFLSTMIAVTLYPVLRKLQNSSLPDWSGIFIIISAIVLSTGLIFTLILPPLIEQGSLLMTHIPALQESLLAQLPQTGPFRTMTTNALNELGKINATAIVTPLMSIGQIALSGFAEIFLVLIFAIYLLMDGPRAVDWILAFFSEVPRNKLRATATETSKVISAYVGGQMIICIICGTYTLIVLSILKVPAALMLATIAGIFDILPVLGFFLAAGPAIILGLTISPVTGVLVAGAYILYHAIENYFLIPRIYG